MIARKLFYLMMLRRQCWLPKARLLQIQEKKLVKLVRHAAKNVPYYREVFRSLGMRPEDFRTRQDLAKLPVLTRDVIQERPHDLISDGFDIESCRVRRTSGSTGNPSVFIVEPKADDYGHALDFRSMAENGYRFRKKMLEITDPRHSAHKGLVQRLGLYRLDMASVYDTPQDILRDINMKRPAYVKGYPSILAIIASNGKLEDFGLQKVYTTSELLSDRDRKLIKGSFAADVIDLYGSVEFPRVAWECDRHEGYHMDIDSVVVELTEKGREIEEGKGDLTLTSLYNYAMPLIRYNVGDMAEIEKGQMCSCGRGLPLIKSIQGRSNDRIILPSGREIPPLILYNSDLIKGVRSFKLIQKTKSQFEIQIVKGPDFNPSTYDGFRQTIERACHGEKISVKFKTVDDFPRDKSGKFRAVVSLVSKS